MNNVMNMKDVKEEARVVADGDSKKLICVSADGKVERKNMSAMTIEEAYAFAFGEKPATKKEEVEKSL